RGRQLRDAEDRGTRAEARVGALDVEQRTAAGRREAAEAERLVATKDLEQAGREGERAAMAAEACQSEMRELRAELASAEAEMAAQRAVLLEVEAEAQRTGSEIAGLLSAIERDQETEAEGAQRFLDLQVELAALAGRMDAARSDVERIGADEVDARARIESAQARQVSVRARLDESAGERARLGEPAAPGHEERRRAGDAARVAADGVQGLTDRVRGLTDEVRTAESELARTSHDLQELAVRLTETRVRRQDLEAEARRQHEATPEILAAAVEPERDLAETEARLEAVAAKIASLEPVNLIADD